MSETSSVDIFGDFTRLSQNQDVSKLAYFLTYCQTTALTSQGYLNTFGTAVGSLLKSFSYLCRQKGLTDNYYEATTGIIGRVERLRPLLPDGTVRHRRGTGRGRGQALDGLVDAAFHAQDMGRVLDLGPRDAAIHVHGWCGDTLRPLWL